MIWFLLFLFLGAAALTALLAFFIGGKQRQAIFELTPLVVLCSGVLLGLVWAFAFVGYLPLHHLALLALKPAPDYLANTVLVLEAALLGFVIAGAVGYFYNQTLGAGRLLIVAFLAALVCLSGAMLPALFWDVSTTPFLLMAVFLIGAGIVWGVSGNYLKGRGKRVLALLWFGYCALFATGYILADQAGLFLITLPALLVFWGGLYFISQYLFPDAELNRRQAFKSLLSFALGTNYPFYVIEDWKTAENRAAVVPTPRVPGDMFSQFFAGPGLILTGPDHLAVTWDGIKHKVKPPGVSFTGMFEKLYAPVDLRPQLRTMTIKAETKDGIPVSIFTFMPHRIATGGKDVQVGASFPYDEEAVLEAVYKQATVEHIWKQSSDAVSEELRLTPWDELIKDVAPPQMKAVIADYECMELHVGKEDVPDPRAAISNAFLGRLKQAIKPLGLEMAGGGISNIEVSGSVFEQRVKNWRVKWEQRIDEEVGDTLAESARQIERVLMETRLELMKQLTEVLADVGKVTDEVLVYRLIEAIGAVPGEADMVEEMEKIRSEEGSARLRMRRTERVDQTLESYLARFGRRRSI